MRRRKFLTLLGSAAVACPLTAGAQQTRKLPTVAYMHYSPTFDPRLRAAFTERLRELGWIEGRTVAIEYRWSEGRPERVAEIAAELVQQKVHVIFTYGAAVATLKQATTSIPIVLVANDPVGSGLVASLSRPGGNVTGLSLQAPESAGKRLELLRELVPGLRRLAILFSATYPAAVLEKDNVQAAARNLGLEVEPHVAQRAEDVAPVFDALRGKADALYVIANSANSARIATLALNMKLPTTFENATPVRAGGLMSYGPDLADLFRRAADFVDKILRGAKPGETDRAADQIQPGHKPQDCRSAWPLRTACVAHYRGRGHRMNLADVALWHNIAHASGGTLGDRQPKQFGTFLTHMYGPAVRCKGFFCRPGR